MNDSDMSKYPYLFSFMIVMCVCGVCGGGWRGGGDKRRKEKKKKKKLAFSASVLRLCCGRQKKDFGAVSLHLQV